MNYYEQLSISKSASPEDIKKAFKRELIKESKSKQDKIDNLKLCFDTLIDPTKRSAYDKELFKDDKYVSLWRDSYKTYNNDLIKKDREYGQKIIKEVCSQKISRAPVYMGFLFLFSLLLIGLAGIYYIVENGYSDKIFNDFDSLISIQEKETAIPTLIPTPVETQVEVKEEIVEEERFELVEDIHLKVIENDTIEDEIREFKRKIRLLSESIHYGKAEIACSSSSKAVGRNDMLAKYKDLHTCLVGEINKYQQYRKSKGHVNIPK